MPKQGFAVNNKGINRAGRPPKEQSLTTILRAHLNKKYKYKGKPIEGKNAIAVALVEMALDHKHKNQLSAIQYIYNRVDGAPRQTVDNNTKSVYVIHPPDQEHSEVSGG